MHRAMKRLRYTIRPMVSAISANAAMRIPTAISPPELLDWSFDVGGWEVLIMVVCGWWGFVGVEEGLLGVEV